MNNNKIIIGLIGEIASGKSSIAQYLKHKYDAEMISFAEPLRNILDRLYLPQTRENMIYLGKDLRDTFDKNIIGKVAIKKVEKSEKNIICLPNVRIDNDIKYLKDLPNFFLINIEVDAKKRYERLISRSENPDDKTKTWEQFLKDSELPTEKSIRDMVPQAKYTIDNSRTLEETQKQVDKLIEKVKSNK